MKNSRILVLLATGIIALASCKKPVETPTLTINKTTLTEPTTKVNDTVLVTSNVSWHLGTLPSWIKATSFGGMPADKLIFIMEENQSQNARSAEVQVTAESLISVIKITQAGRAAFIAAKDSTFNISSSGQSDSIMITSNVDYTIDNPAGWVHLDKTSGSAGKSTIHFVADMNSINQDQQAILTLKGSGAQDLQIKINQKSFLQISTVSPAYGHSGDIITLTGHFGANPVVKVNGVTATNVSMNLSATEIQFKVADGSTTGKITVSCDNNISLTSEGNFQVNAGYQKIVNGNQETMSHEISFMINNMVYWGLGYLSNAGSTNILNVADPSNFQNGWQQQIMIPAAMSKREYASATSLNNVAYVGLGAFNGTSLNDWWSFDGTTWTRQADFPGTGDTKNGLAFSVAGKIYAGAPASSGVIYQFTPGANGGSWQPASSTAPKLSSSICVTTNNYAYIIGGTGSNGPAKSLYKFDPSNNSFTQLADCPVSLYGARAFVIAGKIVVFTGSTTYQYDIDTDKWKDVHGTINGIVGSSPYESLSYGGQGYLWDAFGTLYKYIPVP